MELVCGSWESINSPYRKMLRVQYAEKSTRREFARNYDPFSLSSSSQFRTPTYFYLPPSLSLSLSFFLHPFFSSLIVLPVSLFLLLDSPIVFLCPRSLLHDRPLIFYTFLSVPFLIFISRIPASPPRLTLHSPFFPSWPKKCRWRVKRPFSTR